MGYALKRILNKMTPVPKKKEYIIMDKDTGRVIHEGADRRSVLPNAGDFKTQMIVGIATTLLVGILTVFGYSMDNAYKGMLSSMDDLKNSQQQSFQKIWNKIEGNKNTSDNQYSWILNQCCQSAKYPPPVMPQGS